MSASPTVYPHSKTPWKTISIGSAVERCDWHWAHPKPWSGQFDLTLECDCWLWFYMFYMRVGCFCSLGKTWVSHSVTRFCKNPGSSCRLQRLGAHKYCRSHPEVEHWSIKTEIFSDRIAVAHRFISNADAQVNFAWWPAVRQKKKVSDSCFFWHLLVSNQVQRPDLMLWHCGTQDRGWTTACILPWNIGSTCVSWRKQHGLTLKAGNIHGIHRWASTAVGYICFFVVERRWRCTTFKCPPQTWWISKPDTWDRSRVGQSSDTEIRVTQKSAMEPISTPSRAMTRVRSEDKNRMVQMLGNGPNFWVPKSPKTYGKFKGRAKPILLDFLIWLFTELLWTIHV